MKKHFINRELSWLSFNERVLQEASDKNIPLIERLRFLGIFSNNLDEFFRVRVATVQRMKGIGSGRDKELFGIKAKKLLGLIQEMVLKQTHIFEKTYQEITKELKEHNIHILNEKQLNKTQGAFVKDYFHELVRPVLVPITANAKTETLPLKDHAIYLFGILNPEEKRKNRRFVLIQVPTDEVSRFVVLPSTDHESSIILLDDVIRYCLDEMLLLIGSKNIQLYMVKLTRDAELDFDNDFSKSILEKISKSVKARQKAEPVRLNYDEKMPAEVLNFLCRKLGLSQFDNIIPGGRYHNFRDFMKFPQLGPKSLVYDPLPPLSVNALNPYASILDVIREKDVMLHYPYQSFSYLIDVLREGAIDPNVTDIKITLYRVAQKSKVINALINAARNGKKVTVIMELQARFDEEQNIYWSNKLQEEGVKVLFGVSGLKVHSKLLLISRIEKNKPVHYANIATGNYHEDTATVYCDHSLFTADKRITKEVNSVFEFIEKPYKDHKFNHLILSPMHARKKFYQLIHNEIKRAQSGKRAWVTIKLNNLVDTEMIELLYEASQAGVKIKLIVRGTCGVVPGIKGMSENIEAISIVDRFLEHARVLVFCNDGDELYFISSGDWMTRNLDNRVEVTCPVYDEALRKQLKDILRIQWSDNVKARILNDTQNNVFRQTSARQKIRSQYETYQYLKRKFAE